MMLVRVVLLATLVLASGCCDRTPADIRYGEPQGPVYGKRPIDLAPRVVNKTGATLEGQHVAISAVPVSVAVATGSSVTCVSTGDATVTLSGAGLSTNFTLQCRLVERIEAPANLRVIMGIPERVSARALDQWGRPVAGVMMDVSSASPDIVEFGNGTATGRSVGRGVLRLSAGDASTSIAVEVVEKILTDTLVLSDGQTSTRTLNRGNYLVEINVSSGGSSYGVKANWVGVNCPSHAESQHLTMRCSIPNAGSLVIENPTTFGLGPSATGNIVIYRVP